MKRMWSKEEIGGSVYQHLIEIGGPSVSITGTFLLFSSSSTPINSASALSEGLVMNGLGATNIDGSLSLEGYGVKQANGNIVFKGIVDAGGSITETTDTITPSNYEMYSFNDVVSQI